VSKSPRRVESMGGNSKSLLRTPAVIRAAGVKGGRFRTCYYRLPSSLKLLNNPVDILDTLREVGIPPQLGQFHLKDIHSW
jgi:hypothetical protein